jgi:hypothetical protein
MMFGVRIIAFILTVLLATGDLEPEWEVLALVLGLAIVSIHGIYGLTFAVLAGVLLVQEPDPSETLTVIAAVFAGVSAFLSFVPTRGRWYPRPEWSPEPRFSPSLMRRLRRWQRVSDF